MLSPPEDHYSWPSRGRRALHKLDRSFIGIDSSHHLLAIHGNVAFIERHRPPGLWKRLDDEVVSFEISGDGYRIVLAGTHPTRHRLTGLPERCLTGYRAARCGNFDLPISRNIRRPHRSDRYCKRQRAQQKSSNHHILPSVKNEAGPVKVNWNQRDVFYDEGNLAVRAIAGSASELRDVLLRRGKERPPETVLSPGDQRVSI